MLQPHTHVLKPKVDPGSEEYVLEQLSLVEQKLVSLAEELNSRDLETIHKEMADEEVYLHVTFEHLMWHTPTLVVGIMLADATIVSKDHAPLIG